MFQEIIVYLIVAITILYILWNNIKKILPILSKKYKDLNVCSGCSNNNCSLKVHNIKNNPHNQEQKIVFKILHKDS